jgi:hypothetical protein
LAPLTPLVTQAALFLEYQSAAAYIDQCSPIKW